MHIQQHSFDVTKVLAFLGKGELKLGVELEVETSRDKALAAKSVLEALNPSDSPFVCLKADGSLQNGFEIVTAPATLLVHKRRWQPFFAGVEASTLDVGSTTRCGLHVHFGRNILTKTQLIKYVNFINEPARKKFMVAVAGRESVTFAVLAKKAPEAIGHLCKDGGCQMVPDWAGSSSKHCRLQRLNQRYEAVNLTNPKTIETRLFASTTNKEAFFSRLEFVVALIRQCQLAGDADISQAAFCEYVAARKAYPNLLTFLQEKDYIKCGSKP
jgi:hypothetical protein